MLFSSVLKTAILVHFKHNRAELAKTKCRNADRPDMNCQASCYLSEKLKEAESADPVAPDIRQIKELMPFVFSSSEGLKFFHTELKGCNYMSFEAFAVLSGFYSVSTPPPETA